MPKKNIELLLLENVENLGIVGDIVKVKTGYARNYLLPMQMAEFPTDEKIEALKEQRAKAQAELAQLRSVREGIVSKLQGVKLTLVRSCNDQGVLYGSVTQRDISDGLQESGFGVDVRAVRLSQPIRRIGEYPVPVQFDKDLRVEINVEIEPDQPLEEREEMEFDNEGNLIEKTPEERAKEKAEREARKAAKEAKEAGEGDADAEAKEEPAEASA